MHGFSEYLFARLLKVVAQYDASQTNLHAKRLCNFPQRSCRSADRLELVFTIANVLPHLFRNSCLYYYSLFKITFSRCCVCFQSSTQQMSSGRMFCGLLPWHILSAPGVLCTSLYCWKKNLKDMTIMEVNLTGIFKGVYVRRREGEATGWRKHY